MFGKVNSYSIRNNSNRVKNHLSNGYHQARMFLSSLDAGVKHARNIYKAIEPSIEQLNPQVNSHVNKSLAGYDNIKSLVTNVHNDVKREVGKHSLLNF